MKILLEEIISDYKLDIIGSIHIGAHSGEEIWSYKKNNINNLILIEANKNLIKKLRIKKFIFNHFFKMNISLENCIISDQNNILRKLNITNNSQSSSILNLKKHNEIYPNIHVTREETMISRTLDDLFIDKYEIKKFNFINMDIQGAELLALKGAKNILRNIDAIYTEVNFQELYKGCALTKDLDIFLKNYNFSRVRTVTPEHPSWGDALYLKK
jgi:FkbM family methyltransferase